MNKNYDMKNDNQNLTYLQAVNFVSKVTVRGDSKFIV